MARLVLRDYQSECVASHYNYFANNADGNPLFVIPTAGGKSLVIAEFIRRSLDAWPETRVLVVTHVMELIEQNYNEFVNHWGGIIGCPAGIYSAGLGRRESQAKVLFAGIQSIYNKVERLGWFDLVLVDECHLIKKKASGRYRTYLEALRKTNPAVRVCGYTATPFRMDGGYLHKGKDRLFTDIAYDVKLEPLIEDGYLAPLVAKLPKNIIDTSDVHTVAGDFKKDELERAAMRGDMVQLAVSETVELAEKYNRHHWLFFGTSIAHAEAIMEQLSAHGIQSSAVFGHTPKDERAATIKKFKAGNLTALVNVGVLTTGFNAPCCDMIALMRPTKSTALYIQILGRAMRTHPGKKDALILDFGENVARHGPINRVRVRDKGEGPPPTKVCPECASILMAGLAECPECGYIFPKRPRETKHEVTASELKPFDPEANKPKLMKVTSMFFRRHEKTGKPDSLRVDFLCGMRTITAWVCLEHGGFAQKKAGRWWFQFGGTAPIPVTVEDALGRQHEIKQPIKITVIPDGDYERIGKPIFEEEEQKT